jgi:hypothetical protein
MKAEQMVEENQFFREATLKICGSLEIEKALTNVHPYLRQFIAGRRPLLECLRSCVGGF